MSDSNPIRSKDRIYTLSKWLSVMELYLSQATKGSDEFISTCLRYKTLEHLIMLPSVSTYGPNLHALKKHCVLKRQRFVTYSPVLGDGSISFGFLICIKILSFQFSWETVLTQCTASSCWFIYSSTVLLLSDNSGLPPFQSFIILRTQWIIKTFPNIHAK